MHCSKCGYDNPSGAKYCLQCGKPLSASKTSASQPRSASELRPSAYDQPQYLSEPIDPSMNAEPYKPIRKDFRQYSAKTAPVKKEGWSNGKIAALIIVLTILALLVIYLILAFFYPDFLWLPEPVASWFESLK